MNSSKHLSEHRPFSPTPEAIGDLAYDELSLFLKVLGEYPVLSKNQNASRGIISAVLSINTAWKNATKNKSEQDIRKKHWSIEEIFGCSTQDLGRLLGFREDEELSKFLLSLSEKLKKDSRNDQEWGRPRLAAALIDASMGLNFAAIRLMENHEPARVVRGMNERYKVAMNQ